ncbi:NAD-dependent epimerase/dehydratase family protein [Propionibacteriaceae bacterium Y2011]
MAGLQVLLIGGTGIISSAVAVRAVAQGHRVTLLNRGTTARRAGPDGAEVITGDIRDVAGIRSRLGDRSWDVVADFVAYTPDHVRADIDLFDGRTRQYVFISSASAYAKPVARLPITEATPLANPHWDYARQKIACEVVLAEAFRSTGFPITIVRPSSTYDRTKIALLGGWTAADRIRRGLPVVVPGDGTSRWVQTHTDDVAVGLAGLFGNPAALGGSFHLTSDESLTWDQIYRLYGEALGVEPDLVHLATDSLAHFLPELAPGWLGDKSHTMIFDNSLIRAVVPEFNPTIPYATGVRDIVAWFDADEARRVVDPVLDTTLTRIVDAVRGLGR